MAKLFMCQTLRLSLFSAAALLAFGLATPPLGLL
jgi:hypothetical protein